MYISSTPLVKFISYVHYVKWLSDTVSQQRHARAVLQINTTSLVIMVFALKWVVEMNVLVPVHFLFT